MPNSARRRTRPSWAESHGAYLAYFTPSESRDEMVSDIRELSRSHPPAKSPWRSTAGRSCPPPNSLIAGFSAFNHRAPTTAAITYRYIAVAGRSSVPFSVTMTRSLSDGTLLASMPCRFLRTSVLTCHRRARQKLFIRAYCCSMRFRLSKIGRRVAAPVNGSSSFP